MGIEGVRSDGPSFGPFTVPDCCCVASYENAFVFCLPVWKKGGKKGSDRFLAALEKERQEGEKSFN